jgi:lipopolysaccharide transport system permease protein
MEDNLWTLPFFTIQPAPRFGVELPFTAQSQDTPNMTVDTTSSPGQVGHLSVAISAGAPSVVIEAKKGLFHLDLRAVWQYRELLFFLVWREIKVRYKQTLIGAAWAILQPLLTMAVFTVIFGKFAKIPSDGLPYPLFAYTALLPWVYFAQALGRSGVSLVGDANLIKKVYFPRLVIPLASAVTPLVDFCLAFSVLVGMMLWFSVAPSWGVLALPLFLFLALATALSVSLWLAPLNVRYRDIRHALPFLVQIWMYASPVAYPVSIVPEKWRLLYSMNPLVGIIEGFRWALLGKESPDFTVMIASTVVVSVLLFGGIVYFSWMERTFADVI